jgi:hypothetical protein
MSSNSGEGMEICLVVEFNVFPSKKKKKKKCVYMNIHNFIAKPELSK